MITLSILLSALCAVISATDTLQARTSTTRQLSFTLPLPENSQSSPFPEVCGNQSIEFPLRIKGGREASLSDFPWMARIRHRNANGSYNYGCAGFLISEYFVLTAAHCIVSKSLKSIGPIVEVQLGEHNTETNPDCEKLGDKEWCADEPQFIKTGEPQVHPGYYDNNQYHNDIALLPLKEAAQFTKFVYPICLATKLSQENEMWLAGWGKTENRISTTTQLPFTLPPSEYPQPSPFPEICGNQSIVFPSRILGGSEATLSDFPWMARIRHRSASGLYNYGCAGFLISEYFVLTAAHCIVSKSLASIGPIVEVQLGEHNTETNPDCERRNNQTWCADLPQFIKTGKPKVHPEYSDNNQFHNDIALLPLKEAAQFTKFVYPICLATELSQENEMWLAGWGKTENQSSSTIKLKVLVRRAIKNYCVPLYRGINRRILYSQICAGGEAGVDSCLGDSGGPLMVQIGLNTWYAEGIVSFGFGCGLKDWPAIYTNIPYYIPWITRVMKHYVKKHVEAVQIIRY